MGNLRNWVVTALLVFLAGGACSAQSAASRISGEINSAARVELSGSVSARVASATDLGALPSGTKLSGMTLHVALSSAQKSELDALVQAQQTPGSAYYHQWLTPVAFAARFGLSDSDLTKVSSWLEQQGFSVDGVNTSRTTIRFSGTAAAVNAAFSTSLHRYQANGETHFANATALSLPAALSGVVGSVANLSDFRPKPHLRQRAAADSKVSSMFTSSQSGSHYLTPGDVATIYDIQAAYSAGYTGSGQSIAVVGQSAIETSDITNFQSAAGLTQKAPTVVLVPNSGTSTVYTGDESESDLDLEYAGGTATGATVYFVYVGSNTNYSIFDSIQYAIDTDIAPIISVSYGECETDLTSTEFNSYETTLEQGAAQGQSIVASAGDDGSTGCYSDTTLTTTQREALVASYPATSQYATAVGGTEFPVADTEVSNTTYWASASSSDVVSSVLSYIPEVVWNDDSSTDGLSSGGGGTSIYATRPSWQTGVTGITTAPDYSKGYRLVPDVALDASPNNAGYLYCSSDSQSTGITGSCSNGFRDSSDQYLTVAGGTSFGAPIFAGMLAILNQKQNASSQGLVNSTLYTLAANSSSYSSAFHDITSGSNACSAGSSYCSTAGESEYSATTGYDEASGLGSVNFYNLMGVWPASTSSALAGSTTTLTAASSSPSSGAADSIAITVASASSSVTATPTGTLSVSVDGTVVNSSLALASGSASYSFSSTTSGSHTITATYSGDANYASSTGSVVVTVGSTTSSSGGTFTVSLSPASLTVASGSSGATSAVVTPANGYTGTVAWTISTTSSYLQNDACYTVSDATVTGTSAVSTTLTLYTGTSACSAVGASKNGKQSFKAAGSALQARTRPAAGSPLGMSLASGGLGLLLLAGFARRRRKFYASMLALLALGWLGMLMTACSSSALGTGSTNVPTGTYSISVEGYDSTTSSISSTATLTVNVD